jgi:hypothetical protein
VPSTPRSRTSCTRWTANRQPTDRAGLRLRPATVPLGWACTRIAEYLLVGRNGCDCICALRSPRSARRPRSQAGFVTEGGHGARARCWPFRPRLGALDWVLRLLAVVGAGERRGGGEDQSVGTLRKVVAKASRSPLLLYSPPGIRPNHPDRPNGRRAESVGPAAGCGGAGRRVPCRVFERTAPGTRSGGRRPWHSTILPGVLLARVPPHARAAVEPEPAQLVP